MRVDLRGRRIEPTGALQEFVRRRLDFALDRFEDRLRSVTVRLVDVNGPRGGVDKECRIQLDLPGDRPVVVGARNEDLYAAIGDAVDRSAGVLSKRLSRQPRRRGSRRERAFAAS